MHRLWQFLAWFVPADGGLVKPGKWCVEYPDGKRSRGIQLGHADTLRAIYGGKIRRVDRSKRNAT